MKYQARNNYLINWPEYPLLRICVFFMMGIGYSNAWNLPLNTCLNGVFTLFIGYILVSIFIKQTKNIIRITSVTLLLIGFLLGVLRCELQKTSNNTFHYSHFIEKENFLEGRICSELKKTKRFSTIIDVLRINGRKCNGKLLIYFSERDSMLNYKKGDVLSIKGSVQFLKSNQNPRAFDYAKFLKFKGVDAQLFLKEQTHSRIGYCPSHFAIGVSDKIRSWALSIFERRLKNKDNLATASAMVLGHRTLLSDELYTSFSETGAVHVLAVSGLHVGIICMIFMIFFNRFKREDRVFKWIKLISLLFVVWTYALVTGSSPAVLRASVMFSMILIGRLWFRSTSIYNILAFSALLLLVYNPYLLFQLSFQFSYLALISILFFQPRIERLYDTKHKVTTKIWQLTAVSIAAQVLIFPVSLYYFHTFPSYFILSGVAAVFLATFILVMGLLLLCLDAVPILGDIVAFCYNSTLKLFLNIIYGIQSLPFNKVEGIYISKSSLILLYISIGCIMVYLSLRPTGYKGLFHKKLKRKKILKVIAAISIIFLFVNNLLYTYTVINHRELIVYDVSRNTIIDVFSSRQLYSITSPSIDESAVHFTCGPYRIFKGQTKAQKLDLRAKHYQHGFRLDGNGGMIFKNKVCVLMNNLTLLNPYVCNSDIVLVTHGTDVLPYDFLNEHSTALVVLDNSLSYRIKNHWKKECLNRGISIHDIRQDGVLRI